MHQAAWHARALWALSAGSCAGTRRGRQTHTHTHTHMRLRHLNSAGSVKSVARKACAIDVTALSRLACRPSGCSSCSSASSAGARGAAAVGSVGVGGRRARVASLAVSRADTHADEASAACTPRSTSMHAPGAASTAVGVGRLAKNSAIALWIVEPPLVRLHSTQHVMCCQGSA
jgi:hypothetical protein